LEDFGPYGGVLGPRSGNHASAAAIKAAQRAPGCDTAIIVDAVGPQGLAEPVIWKDER
jgi:hypothetical protein